MIIHIMCSDKKITVKVPDGIDDIKIEMPNVENIREDKKPLILLASR